MVEQKSLVPTVARCYDEGGTLIRCMVFDQYMLVFDHGFDELSIKVDDLAQPGEVQAVCDRQRAEPAPKTPLDEHGAINR